MTFYVFDYALMGWRGWAVDCVGYDGKLIYVYGFPTKEQAEEYAMNKATI